MFTAKKYNDDDNKLIWRIKADEEKNIEVLGWVFACETRMYKSNVECEWV